VEADPTDRRLRTPGPWSWRRHRTILRAALLEPPSNEVNSINNKSG
jgi:hypothetical protein